MPSVPYANVIRIIMYAMMCTHPNILTCCQLFDKFIENLYKVHQQAIKWILYYFRGAIDVDLVYEKSSSTRNGVEGFVNSYYAGDLDKRKSFIGYVSLFQGVPSVEKQVFNPLFPCLQQRLGIWH